MICTFGCERVPVLCFYMEWMSPVASCTSIFVGSQWEVTVSWGLCPHQRINLLMDQNMAAWLEGSENLEGPSLVGVIRLLGVCPGEGGASPFLYSLSVFPVYCEGSSICHILSLWSSISPCSWNTTSHICLCPQSDPNVTESVWPSIWNIYLGPWQTKLKGEPTDDLSSDPLEFPHAFKCSYFPCTLWL